MKVSIITVSCNSVDTIEDTILSVSSQSYPEIEHIIIDGASTDGTTDIINNHKAKITYFISEPDMGIYDAMNKGIARANGDLVGILNADDLYYDCNVIASIVAEFKKTNTDSIFADLVYVKKNDTSKVVRYYRSKNFKPYRFAFGWMPAHPTFFAKKEVYQRYGVYRTDYKIAADYELLVRFIATHKISYSYMPKILVRMRMGGVSTRSLKNTWTLNREIIRACKDNGISTNILKVLTKYPAKLLEFTC